jgi:hypothetical protein
VQAILRGLPFVTTSQFEFEMRFHSVRVQRLSLFAQVIAIFKKEIETIDVFGPLRPAGDVFQQFSFGVAFPSTLDDKAPRSDLAYISLAKPGFVLFGTLLPLLEKVFFRLLTRRRISLGIELCFQLEASSLPFTRGSQFTIKEFGGGAVGTDPIAPAEQIVNFVGDD